MRVTRAFAAAAFSFSIVAAAAAPAEAFCGFYVSGADRSLVADATQVVLMRDGTRTVLSMQNDYKGPPEDFAMVVPVPVVLQKENVKTLDRAIFERVDKLSAPRLVEYWEKDPCPAGDDGIGLGDIGTLGHGAGFGSGSGGLGGRAEPLVTIEAKFEVGEYDVVILSSQSGAALEDWLRENKYKIPAGAEPLLRPYVQAGSKFFVAKVNAAKLQPKDGVATLSPLRFHYDSEKFELPVRLGLVNSAGKQDLVVQVLAEQRYEVANYPNATIPTNLDVAESARGRFGDFYAALFDRTLEKTPGAVVTEYAWGASGCDPCPSGVSGLPPEDVVALGADVLPKVVGMGGPKIGNRGPAPTIRYGAVRTTPGGLPAEVVQRVIRIQPGRFRLCYENGLRTNPKLEGRLKAKFVIAKDGTVKGATDAGSTLSDAAVVKCSLGVLSGMTFPVSADGKATEATLPISMTPGDPARAGRGAGWAARSNLPPYVLTRLHARYDKSTLGADLVFREAKPITGGRERKDASGHLEQGAREAPFNNFQGRYAIRHPWPGKIACENPRRGVWGGPWPDAGVDGDPVAAPKSAYVKREGLSLAAFLTSAQISNAMTAIAVAPGEGPGSSDAGVAAAAGATDAAAGAGATAAPASGSRCGCRTVGERGAPFGALVVAVAALAAAIARRGRRG